MSEKRPSVVILGSGVALGRGSYKEGNLQEHTVGEQSVSRNPVVKRRESYNARTTILVG